MKKDVMRLTKNDVVARLLSLRKIKGKNLEIQCDAISTVSFKDIIDLYLYLSGARSWRWVDVLGVVSSEHSFARSMLRVFRDILIWLPVYAHRTIKIYSLRKQLPVKGDLHGNSSVLYLRTDHWFNINSGGSVGHIRGVVHGLRSLGLHTDVVSTDHLAGIEKDECFHLCRPVYGLGRNLPGFPEILYNDQLLSYLNQKWKTLSPSFVYQRYSLGNYTGVLLKRQYGIPFVCEYNGPLAWVARNWDRRKLFHEKLMIRIELLNLHAADLVVVVSRALRKELVARGIERDKILVNPNGVDVEQYKPEVDSSAVKKKYDLGKNVIIGFIGTFGKWHGAEILAEAFGRLSTDFPEYRRRAKLFMIGEGVTTPEVRRRIAQYRVADSCVLTGLVPQNEGPVHLAACDILVSPHVPNLDGTPFFGSPTKLFEYMAMGKGIVASDLEQIGEILEHEKTAWMVKPGDPEALKLGLKELIDKRELREGLGRAARQEVAANYTWKEHTRRIVDRLRVILNKRI